MFVVFGEFGDSSGHSRTASSSWISPSPPSDGGEGWGEEVRFYWFPLSSVLSPLVPRGERMECLMQPCPPAEAPSIVSMSGSTGNGLSVPLVLVHDQEAAAAFSPDAQQHALVLHVLCGLDRFFGGFDPFPVDLLDHVARPQAGFEGG